MPAKKKDAKKEEKKKEPAAKSTKKTSSAKSSSFSKRPAGKSSASRSTAKKSTRSSKTGGSKKGTAKKAKADKGAAKEKVDIVSLQLSGGAKPYQPHETYQVGDTIKHPIWNEEGKVKKVATTEDGLHYIVVQFPERGERRLVIDYSLKI